MAARANRGCQSGNCGTAPTRKARIVLIGVDRWRWPAALAGVLGNCVLSQANAFAPDVRAAQMYAAGRLGAVMTGFRTRVRIAIAAAPLGAVATLPSRIGRQQHLAPRRGQRRSTPAEPEAGSGP
jgi:hypothetical protein